MAANNEIEYCNRWQTLVQSPRAQSIFPYRRCSSHRQDPLNVEAMKIDLMSMTAHKVYGPKGTALYVKRPSQSPIVSQLHGGGHERGMRSGTYEKL